eukprot:CAMPEP_0169098130 /NCGR_PEP_ID=MMETSP1015-20121227/19874_1 /TAXON_ID=342587 /ORGANISM="Karlodinium micrum, Strain CCMP2283" /LENGTH=146 /DNA_ID=CAMNT_0009158953 /DNA_START=72 /DNA_END=512 /DNA_ORIENTATION=+
MVFAIRYAAVHAGVRNPRRRNAQPHPSAGRQKHELHAESVQPVAQKMDRKEHTKQPAVSKDRTDDLRVASIEKYTPDNLWSLPCDGRMIFSQKLIAATSCSDEVEDVNESKHSVQAWRQEHMPSSVRSACNTAVEPTTSADFDDWL